MTIRDVILNAINTDENFKDRDDKAIINIYKGLNETERSTVNNIFIHLTGYSLSTLITQRGEDYDYTITN